MPTESLTITDNRTGKSYVAPDRARDDQGPRPPADQGVGRGLRADDVRPGVHEHGVLQERHHLHRRRQAGSWSTAGTRSTSWPSGAPSSKWRTCIVHGELPTQRAARRVALRDRRALHPPREHQEVHRRVPPRRAPDGDAAEHGGGAVDVLSGREEHLRPGDAAEADLPADRQDADAGGVRVPAQPGAAVRVPGPAAQLRRELHGDAVEADGGRGPLHGRTRRWSGRSTSCSSCTPTTSRTAAPARCGWWAPRSPTRTARWRRGSAPCSGRCTAAPTRKC